MLNKYPINPNDPVVCWGRVHKEMYWGRKSGGQPAKDVPGQFIFKIKKWNNGAQNHGPCGFKLKKFKRGLI